MSWLNDAVDWTDSAELCWSTCEARHGDALIAIDWWPADTPARGCWCQNDCMCMDDGEIYVSEWECDPCHEDTTGAVTIIRNDVKLPAPCDRDGLTSGKIGLFRHMEQNGISLHCVLLPEREWVCMPTDHI